VIECRFLGRKLCLKVTKKIKPQSPKKNEVDTYEAPVFYLIKVPLF